MTFITVIKTGTFVDGSIEVELDGLFTGNLIGNVTNATCITYEDGMGVKIGNVITTIADETAISIGKGANAGAVGTIAIGNEAEATTTDAVTIGRPAATMGLSATATAEVWGQVFQNRSWDDTTDKIAAIDGTGNMYKTTVDTTSLSVIGNITSRCLTGTRVGSGNVTLTTSPNIPNDEVWGFTIDVVGREVSTTNRFYEQQTIIAMNNAGNVEVNKIATIASLGVGGLSADAVFVQGNATAIEVVVTTGSTGTTNWTAKMHITTVT